MINGPSFLPHELAYCQTYHDDQELLEALNTHPLNDTILFFLCACEDETWTSKHPLIMKEVLQLLTTQFFVGKLSLKQAKSIALGIQNHFKALQPLMYFDLTVFVDEIPIPINSLLFSANSVFFHDLINRQCYAKKRRSLELKSTSLTTFNLINEFICSGQIENLWKLHIEDLSDLLKQATAWQIQDLAELCSQSFKKFINEHNIYSILKLALKDNLKELKMLCFAFFNERSSHLNISETPDSLGLIVEINSLDEQEAKELEGIYSAITKVIARNKIMNLPQFLSKLPKLSQLDLEATATFYESVFEDIPKLENLNVSDCQWINDNTLNVIIQKCPQLKVLNISKNLMLTYKIWTSFANLKHLTTLDVSFCTQFDDRDMELLTKACPHLRELHTEGCPKIKKNWL